MSEAIDTSVSRDDAHQDENEKNRLLDLLGMSLSQSRSDAINARQASGIEDRWREDLEFYGGIDDANRGDLGRMRGKPFTAPDPEVAKNRGSNVFFNITRPYTDNFAARVGDMLLPVEDDAWEMRPTKIPEMVETAKGKMPARLKRMVREDTQKRYPNLDPFKFEELVDRNIQEAIDGEQKVIEAAEAACERAKQRISDWQLEGQYQSHMRRVIDDVAQVGTGIIKGPIPVSKRQVAYRGGKIIVEDVLKPVSVRVSYWNCFPDPECGDDIHNGAGHWERDDLTKKKLRALLVDSKRTGYLEDQILKCLEEGPHQAVAQFDVEHDGGYAGLKRKTGASAMFEIWYYHGTLDRRELEMVGIDAGEDDGINFDVMLQIVNNRVVKAAFNHLGTGEFPYDYMVCQRSPGSPFGIGIPRQMRTAQRVVNGGGRNMMNNAGLAGGPMMVFARGYIQPADGSNDYSIEPLKIWEMGDLAQNIDDVKKAIGFIALDMMVDELMKIIEFGMKLAEDTTGMPMLMQGQQGSAPETVGGMQLLNNNASAPLRRIAKLFDDLITEPHIRRYYRYLLKHGSDDEKGDFQIDARGSSALVERSLASQELLAMGQFAANPVFGVDPKKWATELIKSKSLKPSRLMFSDPEWEKLVGQLTQQASKQSDAVQVAQIRSESEQKISAEDNATRQAIEALKQENIREQGERDDAYKALEQEIQRMEADNKATGTSDTNQTNLARDLAKIKAQLAIAFGNTTPTAQVASPPTEPPGKAPAGDAYAA